jgi:alkanesulfonate monooxygenase SsuD/methylene tetrahydromethanopterin reductase-like flavin-dependent oxidoreductase (luciferase family)
MPIADILQCARVAEEAGFGFISVAESFYRDGAALAAAIACNTRTIRLGTSVFPIYTRTPFQLAMAMASLDELSSGRMGYLGLGVGYRNRTEDYFGIKIERPLERMREYVDIIRRLLAGDETGYQGEFFRFKTFPKFAGLPLHIPIYFGSSGAKMLSLAGEVADGVILNSLVTPAHIQQAKALMQQGAARAGRDPSRLSIAASVIYAEVGKASRWREFRQGMWEVVSNRAIVIASSVEAAMYLGVGALMGFLPLYAKNIAQLSDASVGVLIWVPLVMAMVGKPLAGRISDRLGRKPVIAVD